LNKPIMLCYLIVVSLWRVKCDESSLLNINYYRKCWDPECRYPSSAFGPSFGTQSGKLEVHQEAAVIWTVAFTRF